MVKLILSGLPHGFSLHVGLLINRSLVLQRLREPLGSLALRAQSRRLRRRLRRKRCPLGPQQRGGVKGKPLGVAKRVAKKGVVSWAREGKAREDTFFVS